MRPNIITSPTPVTATALSTPDFCRNRMFTAVPPTLAGVTRFVNDDANWVMNSGHAGNAFGTEPAIASSPPT